MDYVLDRVTLFDWLELSERVAARKKRDALLQLAIVQNPYTEDPQALFDEIKRDGESKDDIMDKKGFAALKQKLSKSKMIAVK